MARVSDISGLGRLEANIVLDTSGLSAGVATARTQFGSLEGATAKSSGAVQGLNTKFGGLGGTLKSFGTTFAAVGAFDLFSGSIEAAGEAQKVMAQTEAGIASTGGAAGVSAEHIGSLAERIKKLSGFEDESVQAGANMLLTFTNIRNAAGEGNDIFDQSTLALADMAARMGTDVPSAAVQLGKALNDPIAGVGALARVGVQFSDEQKNTIQTMVESGDVMGAQKVILGELNTQFGGSAKALGDARTPMEKFQLAVGDLQEKVGVALLPAIEKLTPSLTSLAASVEKIMPVLEPVITFMASAPLTINVLSDAFSSLGPIVDAVGGFFANLGTRAWEMVTTVGDAIGTVVGFIAEMPGRVAELAGGLWNGFTDSFRGAINVLIDAWNSLDFGIDLSLPSWIPGIGGKGFKVDDIIPDIPRLHSGGVVPGRFPGQEVLTMLQAGEMVTPRGAVRDVAPSAGGGVNITVHGPVSREFLREVRHEAEWLYATRRAG